MAADINANEKLRQLPSVDSLLGDDAVQHLIAAYGRRQTVNGLRKTLDAVRGEVRRGADVPGAVEIAARADVYLQERFAPTLQKNQSSLPEFRIHLFIGLHGHVTIVPDVRKDRVRTVHTLTITVSRDLDLNPVKDRFHI